MRILLRWLLIAIFYIIVSIINFYIIALAILFWDGRYMDTIDKIIKPVVDLIKLTTSNKLS